VLAGWEKLASARPGRYRAAVREVSCSGCGAMVPDASGPVHAYLHASPGCWALYCGLEDWKASLATGHDAPTLIQHLVDSYAVQHAANPDRRNRQSVAVHLMSLCASLEQDIPGARLRHMIGTWTGREYPPLVPSPDAYQLTVRDLADALGQDRPGLVFDMARSAWTAWSAHHGQIRAWLAAATARTRTGIR
jgi:Family of unknown function (DUF5946)